MERITVIVFFVLSLSYSSEASFSAEQASVNEPWPAYRNDCFIAFLEENIGEGKQLLYQQVDEEASRGLNVTRMFEFKNIEPGFVFMGDKDSAEKVAKMSGVKSVIPDYVVIGQQSRSVQWHLDRIDQRCLPLDNSYNPFGNGSGVDIYVLDSGANFNHTDIKDSLVYPGRDIIDEVTGSSRKGSDCYGHGTHVAGLAAGKTYGIAPGATIIVIRVLDCRNYGPYTAVMLGIDYVLELIKERKRKAVVSMSLVGFGDIHFDHSVEKLLKTGVPVVAAAGNYKMSACYYSPSRISNVITVGATRQESDGMFWFSNQSSSGTNYGPCVDIFAPGQFVTSAGVECSDCESSRSGTSMATPLVSGMVALLLQKYPNYTAETIKEKLLQLSTKNVLDFSSLPMDKDKEASKTPNRLLYVPSKLLDILTNCALLVYLCIPSLYCAIYHFLSYISNKGTLYI
jgi:subtilisin family serine protease